MSRLADLGPEFDDFVRKASAGLLRISFLLTGDRGQAENLSLSTDRRQGCR